MKTIITLLIIAAILYLMFGPFPPDPDEWRHP